MATNVPIPEIVKRRVSEPQWKMFLLMYSVHKERLRELCGTATYLSVPTWGRESTRYALARSGLVNVHYFEQADHCYREITGTARMNHWPPADRGYYTMWSLSQLGIDALKAAGVFELVVEPGVEPEVEPGVEPEVEQVESVEEVESEDAEADASWLAWHKARIAQIEAKIAELNRTEAELLEARLFGIKAELKYLTVCRSLRFK